MAEPEKSGRKQDGRFAPGQSGNPAGKPKGCRNHATRALETLMGDNANDVAKAMIEMAKKGDTSAARLVLERVMPGRKDAPITFELPAIETAADIVSASMKLIRAVADGEVTPDEGTRVMGLLSGHKALLETIELEARIAALEERI